MPSQHCVFPRMMLTPKDALYTAKFFLLLHHMETPYFSTVLFVHQVVRTLMPALLCSSHREATCLGVFLLETLTVLKKWAESRTLYDKEVGALCVRSLRARCRGVSGCGCAPAVPAKGRLLQQDCRRSGRYQSSRV
jgi:hypothetical protein